MDGRERGRECAQPLNRPNSFCGGRWGSILVEPRGAVEERTSRDLAFCFSIEGLASPPGLAGPPRDLHRAAGAPGKLLVINAAPGGWCSA